MSKTTLPSNHKTEMLSSTTETSQDAQIENRKRLQETTQEATPNSGEVMSSSVMQISTATDLRPSKTSSSKPNLTRKHGYGFPTADKKLKTSNDRQPLPSSALPKTPRNKMSVRNLISDVEVDNTSSATTTRHHVQGEHCMRAPCPPNALRQEQNTSSFIPLTSFAPKMTMGARPTMPDLLPQHKSTLASLRSERDNSELRFPPLPTFSSAFAVSRGLRRQLPDVQRPSFNRQPYLSYTNHRPRTTDIEQNGPTRDEYPETPSSSHKSRFQPLNNEPKAKRPWTEQEDTLLRSLVEQLGQGLWAAIAAQIPGRSGKQVRERWLNHLSPNVTKRPWSSEEDDIIIESHKRFGNCWSRIAKLLDGRSDNSVKNRFYTTLRRRISVPRNTGKRGNPTYAHGQMQGKKRKTSPTLQQPSEQVELVNRGCKQGRVWE